MASFGFGKNQLTLKAVKMLCDLFAVTIISFSQYKYCEPKAVVNLQAQEQVLYWQCDCTRARQNIKFLIDETIWKSIPIKGGQDE
jgi:hypothetical protein